jgi:hypothetical protein
MMSLVNMLVLLGVIVLIVLSGIAAHLHYRLYQHNKRRQAESLWQVEVGQQQRERVNKSIQILAHAVQGEELTLTEACIRISVLLDSLEVDSQVREEFSAFYQLRDLTAHIPILEGWKKLDRKEQVRFDLERLQYEDTYRDFVLSAAKRIKARQF